MEGINFNGFELETRRGVLLFYLISAALLGVSLAWILSTGSDGPQLSLIPTLIALGGAKFFGKKRDGEADWGSHPTVAFILKALATGEMESVDDMVDEQFAAYANGYTVVDPDHGSGPARFSENIDYWRSVVPDLSVMLYDEVSQKEENKTDSVAVRYVMSGTLHLEASEEAIDVEAAAFIKVVDKKLTEWRVVLDTPHLDALLNRSNLGAPT